MSREETTPGDIYQFNPNQESHGIGVSEILNFPSAGLSLLRCTHDYRSRLLEQPHSIGHKMVRRGPAFFVSLWAYSEISGRSVDRISDEGVLAPASILYRQVISQDDNLDCLRATRPTSAKRAFWYENGVFSASKLRRSFGTAIRLIDSNKILGPTVRRYMKINTANAYHSYITSEDELFKLRNSPHPCLAEITDLRTRSYGVMAKALCAILNGSICATPNGIKLENAMECFELAAGIVDSELDRKEDKGRIMTPVHAGDIQDLTLGQREGTTSQRLFEGFTSQIPSSRVRSVLFMSRFLYPKIESILTSLGQHYPSIGKNLTVQRDIPV